ncbi:PREDICTED: CAX-interacting protein 4-like [Fragaria vesca subsp. vesca]|uniref:CAX-interacting protein 4-like n=1 Tax=Fragaria vesca subsp. vesca TaxID=101020 RepID=UPI0002C309BE|nr:PREDICTED: CAX-interacting protein 4-like [Fragaria vesca subsp. vesca]
MPATAGRVRMPANNRVHSSAALQTHGIWQSAIGYDPYAPTKDRDDSRSTTHMNVASSELDAENPYASFQGLLALARITGSNADEARGACKRCGRVGHLSFQCRNFLSVKDDKEKDPEAIQSDVASELRKLRGKLGKGVGKDVVETDSDEEDEDTEDSDSDYDSEIERIIAQKNGKRSVRKEKSKKKKNEESDVDESDTDSGERKKRGRSKKRRSNKRKHDDSDDSEEDRKIRRKEKRRKRDESSDEDGKRHRRHRKSRTEKRRRRSHRYSDDSESDTSEDRHRSRRSKRGATPSDSDASGSDDARVGRGRKRSEKKSRKHHRDEE